MSEFEHHRHPERRKRLSRIASWIIVGALVPTLAVSAISAATCEQTQGLPNASPELSLHCELPGERTVDIAIGGLEPIPGRRIHAFEIFSFPGDGQLPFDDVHIQFWWETTNGSIGFPEDIPPIIRVGR